MAWLSKSRRRSLRQFGIPRLLLLSPSLLFAVSASSRLVNVTVDDTFGDPITGATPEYFTNNGKWLAGFPGQDPATCDCGHINTSILDVTQVHNGTWHDTTPLTSNPPATITVHFTGSAVYVFTILPNTLPVTITLANMSFSIDGEDVGAFVRSPEPGTTSILYDQLVYHNTTLNYGPHTLVITPSNYSLILFDYLLYTTQDGSDTNSSTSALQLTSSTSPNSAPQSSSFTTSPSTTGTSPDSSPQSLLSGAPTSTRTPDGSIPSASSRTRTPVGSIVGPVLGASALLGAVVTAFLLYRRHMRSKLDAEIDIHESKLGDDSGGEGRSGPGHQVGRGYPRTSFSALPSSTTLPLPLDGARAHHLPDLASGTDAASGPLPTGADASPELPPVQWSANHPSLSELNQRLNALHHTKSIFSSQSLSRRARSEVSSEGGTETAVQDLEAEIAQLRGVLSAVRVRLADGRGGHQEPLPVYA